MGKLIGYARVSTGAQDVSLQLDALKIAGCDEDNVFVDKASGPLSDRPGLDACLALLKPGDTLVVWRLDHLGRSMSHLVTMVEALLSKQIGFRSLCDGHAPIPKFHDAGFARPVCQWMPEGRPKFCSYLKITFFEP